MTYTWGDFKRAVEAVGVKEDTQIHYIDFVQEPGTIKIDEDGDLEVY